MAQVAPVMMVVAAGPPGTVMQVQANGATLQIQVPEGCAAGQQFPVALPTAPVVQGVAYVPGEVSGTPGLKGLVAALNMPDGSAGVLDMRQHWSGLEAFTGGAYEKANIYDIHHCPPDPNDKAAKFAPESKVAQIVAHSTTCERTCCAPGHSLMLHVNDRAGNTMVTIQRPGWGTGKYCLNHGACANCCRDEIIVHEGRVDAEATCCLCCHFNFCCFKHFDGCGQRVLKPSPVSKASVPFLGGGCKPQIDVFEDHDSARPNRRVNGPCCFGGCSELCCESKFVYKTLDGRDVGRVRKLVPSSCKDACLEMFTDSDKYSMEFYQGSTNEEKANTIGLALLLDYMFFERDNGMISC